MITTSIATDAITMINNDTRTAATVTPAELVPLSTKLGSVVVNKLGSVVVDKLSSLAVDVDMTAVAVPMVGLVGGPEVRSARF